MRTILATLNIAHQWSVNLEIQNLTDLKLLKSKGTSSTANLSNNKLTSMNNQMEDLTFQLNFTNWPPINEFFVKSTWVITKCGKKDKIIEFDNDLLTFVTNWLNSLKFISKGQTKIIISVSVIFLVFFC